MTTDHIVKQGEFLSKIARDYGFLNDRAIWDSPANAALKATRKNPNVLFPGDRIVIPDKEAKEVVVQTGQLHGFVLRRQPALVLRVFVKTVGNKPASGVGAVLDIDGTVTPITTGPDGKIEHAILPTAQEGKLKVATLGIEAPVRIGDLDPVDKRSGQVGRLNNLGYKAGAPDAKDERRLRSAVEEFQCDEKLRVTGEFDAATEGKLKQVHGC